MRMRVPMRTSPPKASAQRPKRRPIRLPKLMPMAVSPHATMPMTMLGAQMETCMKAMLSPTARASRLVEIVLAARP